MPQQVSLPGFLVGLKGHGCRNECGENCVHEDQGKPHDFPTERKGPSSLEDRKDGIVVPCLNDTLRIPLAWKKLPADPEELPHENDGPDQKGRSKGGNNGLVLVGDIAVVGAIDPSELDTVGGNRVENVGDQVYKVQFVEGCVDGGFGNGAAFAFLNLKHLA